MQNTNIGVVISCILADTQEEILKKHYRHIDEIDSDDLMITLYNGGYEILGDNLPSDIPEDISEISVFVRERESIVTSDSPKETGMRVTLDSQLVWPSGVENDDLNKTIYRTIQFLYENQEEAFSPVRQSVQLKRTAIVNHAKQSVSYTDWKLTGKVNEFAEVHIPQLSGYSTDILTIPSEEVSDDHNDEELITVIYHAEVKQASLKVINKETNECLYSEQFKGKINETISYPITELLNTYIAKGYEIVSNNLVEGQVFSVDRNADFTVVVQPKIVFLDPTKMLPQVGQRVYPKLKDSILWPKGLEKNKLLREITRTIKFKYDNDGDKQESHIQTVVFKRCVLVNLLESTVSYSNWETENSNFPAFTPRAEEGYIVKPRFISERKGISPSSENFTEIVTYTRTIQKVEVHFVDCSRKMALLYKAKLIGKTGERVNFDPQFKIQEFIANGYELVSNEFPKEIHFGRGSGTEKLFYIVLQPKVVSVSSNAPKAAGSKVGIDDNGPWWPSGVDQADLVKKIERTIYYRFLDNKEAIPTAIDSVVFTRNAKVNLVTGQVYYADWDYEHQKLSEKEIPELSGYYSDTLKIPALVKLTPTSPNITYTVRYLPRRKPVSVRVYQAETKEILAQRQTFNRNRSDLVQELRHISVPFLEKGYSIKVLNNKEPYRFNLEKNEVSITLEPVIKVITADEPHIAYTPIEGYERLTWPKGLEILNLQKIITRTVHFCSESGLPIYEPIVQQITFKREAHVRLTDNHISYSFWKSELSEFKAIEVPKYAGHTPNKTVIDEHPVSEDESSQIITVIYRKLPEPIRIRYINHLTQQEMVIDEIVGKESEVLNYDFSKRSLILGLSGYEIVGGDCPQRMTISEMPQEYTIYLVEKVVEVTWHEPKEAYTLLEFENGAVSSWPSGLDLASLSYETQRVIYYYYEDGEQAYDPITQSSHFYRNALVNLVTREVTYGNWQSETLYFEEVANPEISGYEVSCKKISRIDLVAKGEAEFFEEYVVYKKKPYQFIVTVADVLNDIELETLYFKIRAGVRPSYQLDRLIHHYAKQGYDLVETQTSEQLHSAEEARYVKLLLTPQFITVTLEELKNDFKSFEQRIANKLKHSIGLGQHNLSHLIRRRIKYIYQNGEQAAPDVEAVVSYNRQATVNLVTGQLSYGEWYSSYPTFDEVISPLIDRYQASQEISPSIESVSVDDGDITEFVIYSPTIQEVVVNIINKATGDLLYTESLPKLDGFDDEYATPKNKIQRLMQQTTQRETRSTIKSASISDKNIESENVGEKNFIDRIKNYLFNDTK